MGRIKKENIQCFLEGKKGICSLCRYFNSGDCPGYFSTVADIDNKILFRIPLFNEYKENYFKELESKAKESGLIIKQELLNQLKKEGVKITSRTLTYYMDLGLIPKGIKKFIPGLIGSVSFLKENTPLIIAGIEEMKQKYGLTLKEIAKYRNLIYNFNELEITKLNEIEYAKFREIILGFACIEVGYKLGLTNKLIAINDKIYIPQIYVKKEKNRIIEVHIKIIDINILGCSVGKAIKNIEAFKEIIYSKKGIEIIE